ncbi:LacI family DNA-binding transcriptional regulator [Limibacter armeniacum]|uniref:LacI family DNA-binding transcriptional regulator n=1 Tax=Limibacter armeniacum TaxID=466084 RepID=UPI002FE5440A
MKKHTTILDLAHQLGVSTATITRALKGHPDVSESTRKKVLSLAKKLHYHPNAVAAGLRQQSSKLIGVIVPDLTALPYTKMVSSILYQANLAELQVIVCESKGATTLEAHHTSTLINRRVDGLLVAIAKEDGNCTHFYEAEAAGIPIVFFNRASTTFVKAHTVVPDHFTIAYESTKKLISDGYTQILFLEKNAKPDFLKGYLQAFRDCDVPVKKEWVTSFELANAQTGAQYTHYLFKEEIPFEAIITNNTSLANGIQHVLQQLAAQHIKVISLVDNPHQDSEPLNPIYVSPHSIGEKAFELLLNDLQHSNNVPSQYHHVKMPPQFLHEEHFQQNNFTISTWHSQPSMRKHE